MRLAALFVLLTAVVQAATPGVWVDGPTKTIYYTPSTGLGVIYLPTTVTYSSSDTVTIVSGTPPPGVIWPGSGSCGSSVLCSAYTGTPSAAATGVYSVVLRAHVGSNTEDLTVEFRPSFSISGTAAAGVVGASYQTDFSLVGGVLPSAWDAPTGSVPPGLSFDVNTGRLSGTPSAAGAYTFSLAAHDSSPISITKSVTMTVYAALAVSTSNLTATTVSRPYSQTLASSGGTSPKTWSIVSGTLPNGIALGSATGLLSGAATTPGAYSFVVRVDCCGTASATAPLSLVVNPAPSIQTSTLPGGAVGVSYSQQLSGGGGTGALAFSIAAGTLPAGLSLSTSGLISGTPAAMGSSSFTVQLMDSVGSSATASLSIAIIDLPEITPPTLTALTVGQTVQAGLTAINGTSPYIWDLASGALPTGVTLDPATGALQGQPTQSGLSAFTLRVTDAQSQQAILPRTWLVNAAPVITTASLAETTVSRPFTTTTLSGTGGTGTLAWSATGLPAGLTLSAQGELSGSPSVAGSSEVLVTARDDNQVPAARTLSLVVNAAPSIQTSTLTGGTVGTVYSLQLSGSGGTGALNWSVSAGALPAGLGLSASGLISGNPAAAGLASITIQLADSVGAVVTASFTLSVIDPPEITPPTLTALTVGQTVQSGLTAVKGTAPYTWDLAEGALPAGVTLNPSTGALQGQPTQPGWSSFTWRVTDAQSQQATLAQSWLVNPAPAISTAAIPATTISKALTTVVLSGSGGTGMLVWSAAGLPAGLSLSAQGELSGTPVLEGASDVIFTLRDDNQVQASRTLTVTVNPLPIITTSSLPLGVLSSAYSQALAATGGTGARTYSLTGGVLPAGIALAADGTLSGAPAAKGSFSFTVKVEDPLGASSSSALTLEVVDTPEILTVTVPDWTAGQHVSLNLSAERGTAPYKWTLVGGALPSGAQLDADSGALSGTIAAAGSGSMQVRVADLHELTASRTLVWKVNAAPTLDVPVAPQLVVGRPAGAWQLSYQGGTGPLSGYADGLPPGLQLNAHSGLITGTPFAPGRYETQFTLVDGNSMRSTAGASLRVYTGMSIETAELAPVTASRPVARAIALSGGEAPYSWSIAGGKLPAGLTVRMTDGTVEGTAESAELARFTLRVLDANGVEASRAYTLLVHEALSVLPLTLPATQVGQTVARIVQSAGGTNPVVFSLSAGTLPPGVTLAPDGTLGGTLTAAGLFSFSVKATDANGAESTRPLSLEVTAAERLKATPWTLTFEGYAGGAAPAPRQVALSGTPAGQAVRISTDSTWVVASLETAVTPAVVNVSVMPAGLAPGDYMGAILLRQGTETRSVAVTFHYAAAPEVQLTASPAQLTISAGTGAGQVERLLLLRTTSGAEPWTVTTDDAWLSVDRVADSFDASLERVVRVSLRRDNLRAGAYAGTLVFRQGSAVAEVAVRMELSEGSDFELSQSGLSLRALPAGTSAEQPLRILNHGAEALAWRAHASASWMVLEPASGSAQPASTLRVRADAANLAAGRYAGTVTVTPAAGGAERTAQVQLRVSSDGQGPRVTPAGLTIQGTAAVARTLLISNPSLVETGFTASIAPVEANQWLALGSASGTVPADGSQELTVTATPGPAGQGTHRAQIALEFSDGTVTVVDIVLVVPAQGCTATSLQANWVRLGDHFSIPAGAPAELEILVTDNCGQPVSTGLGLVSFSTLWEPALTLIPGPDGLWTATWNPAAAVNSVTLTVRLEGAPGQTGGLSATGVVTAPPE